MTTRGERRARRARRAFAVLARLGAFVAELVAKHHELDDEVAWHATSAGASLRVAADALEGKAPP